MVKEMKLNGEVVNVLYKISRRSKSIRITLHKDGRVILTRPFFASEAKAEVFLVQRSEWILKHLHNYKKLLPLIPRYSKKEVADLKSGLLRKVCERLEHFNSHYKFSYAKVTIRNTKTRWGSCSRKGNLQFSFKMNFIPSHLFDYIIVHELCHLKEFNHGKNFWQLVSLTLPNVKELRQELKRVV